MLLNSIAKQKIFNNNVGTGSFVFTGIFKLLTLAPLSGLVLIFNASSISRRNNIKAKENDNSNLVGSKYENNNEVEEVYNESTWMPTSLMPQQQYNYPRPTGSVLLNIEFIIFTFLPLPTIIFPLIMIISYPSARKKEAFLKRTDKIIKRGMTYDEVIYIMEGFTPENKGYNRNGEYGLDYLVGSKRSNYEQRTFIFDKLVY